MLAVGYQFVNKGQYLGQIKEGCNTGFPGCNLYSFNTHLQFGFPPQNFMMQGVVMFDTGLRQANCPLYSTQNMPNVGIKNDYQLFKTFNNYDSGRCKSAPILLYNPNNSILNLQLKVDGQISTDT